MIDAAFIKQDIYAPSSNVLPNGNAYLMTEEKAVEGDKVKIFRGQNREPVEAVIKSTYCTKEWKTADDNGDFTWYNMIMMYIDGSPYTQDGDSGAPVTVKVDDRLKYYGIVGVYKRADIYAGSRNFYTEDMIKGDIDAMEIRGNRPYAFASNWFQVKRAFGIDSIY